MEHPMRGTKLGVSDEAKSASAKALDAALDAALAKECVILAKSCRRMRWPCCDTRRPHHLWISRLASGVPLIAELGERVLSLGGFVRATAAERLRNKTLTDDVAPFDEARAVVGVLGADHEPVSHGVRAAVFKLAEASSQDVAVMARLKRWLAAIGRAEPCPSPLSSQPRSSPTAPCAGASESGRWSAISTPAPCAACGSDIGVQPQGTDAMVGFCAECRAAAARPIVYRELGGESD
jgi:hypothetical protein